MALAQRFSVNKQSTNGSASGENLSMADIFPIQPISKGSGFDDEKVTLQQIQAIPYGAASLSGTTYTVSFINYPTDFNVSIGQTILVKFNSAKSGNDPLNLSINDQLIPMLMQGEAITEIAANQIIEFTMIGNIVNGSQTITHANASAGVTAAKVNNQINGALTNYVKKINIVGWGNYSEKLKGYYTVNDNVVYAHINLTITSDVTKTWVNLSKLPTPNTSENIFFNITKDGSTFKQLCILKSGGELQNVVAIPTGCYSGFVSYPTSS